MNNGCWLPEEEFKGLMDNFFDDLIDHIDFPLEDIETANSEGDWDTGFQDLVPPPLDVLTSLSSKPLTILKQSSSSEVFTVGSSAPDVKVSKMFQSSSPVSVLDNINGALSQNPNTAQKLATPTLKGIRSKRKRPTTLRFEFLQSFGSGTFQQFALDESESETYLSSENSAKKKHKKNKRSEPFNSDVTNRKCSHCETTKTPQWREGPNGPKTLCNACGVRFRSGRLVPEYRPASSPTFIPTVHSNSHKKIVEMRKKGEDQFDTGMVHAVSSQA